VSSITFEHSGPPAGAARSQAAGHLIYPATGDEEVGIDSRLTLHLQRAPERNAMNQVTLTVSDASQA
jgi:hypothetical protein